MNLLIIINALLWNLLFTHAYIIERRVTYRTNSWIDRPDRFIIPSSVCSSDLSEQSTQCSKMGASRSGRCKCVCNWKVSGNVLYKSTFGFYENEWKCFENTKVHAHGECSVVLDGRDASRRLRVLPMTTPRVSYSVSLPQPTNAYNCEDGEYSYLLCNGTWKQLDKYEVTNRIYASWINDHDNQAYLQYTTGEHSAPTINGQVIRLGFDCYDGDTKIGTPCILFKVTGNITCSLTKTPSSSILLETSRYSSSSPAIIPTTTVEKQSVSSTLSPSPSSGLSLLSLSPSLSSHGLLSSSATPTIPVSVLTLASTVPLSTAGDLNSPSGRYNKPTEGRNTKTNIVTSPYNVRTSDKNTRSDDGNTGLIAGGLTAVIGLAIAIAIIVIVWKRKKRDAVSKNTVVAENAGYERGADNSLRFTDRGQLSPEEDEYSYAYTNAVPFVETKKRDTEEHTHNNEGLESKSFVANHVYGKTEEVQGSPHLEAPIYNTLVEPEYARPNKSKKVHQSSSDAPTHNTLEEPEYARPNKSRKVHQTCADALSHNTLEELGYARPNKSRKVHQTCADAPIYNTLEEPEYGKVNKGGNTKLPENKNEPLYNVLEGPDAEHDEEQSEEPPCYHVLERPFPDGAPVYDVLEGPEPGEAPVYGSLDGPDPHVYGTLDTEGAFKDNREYNDIVYDSVGEVVNDTGDIYQQLNQSGQGGSDVYQGLSYPDKTMYLKELTESHSNV